MEQIDYSTLNKVSLKETNFLSESSNELIEFIMENQMFEVGKFLEIMDNNSFVKKPYMDVLNEARGLADILRNYYFNVPITSDIYLLDNVSRTSFDLPIGNVEMLGIKRSLKKKINIYSVITRLGFNNKELNMIISKYGHKLEDNNLFNIFNEIIADDYYKKDDISDFDKVFYNKVNYYVNYVNLKVNNAVRERIQERIDELLENLEFLLDKRSNIEKQIEDVKKLIEELQEGKRNVK